MCHCSFSQIVTCQKVPETYLMIDSRTAIRPNFKGETGKGKEYGESGSYIEYQCLDGYTFKETDDDTVKYICANHTGIWEPLSVDFPLTCIKKLT
ncbi:hypothetical protein SNEBB_006249 [Seison nebaliae]|nr:hypothetical protein SNEBB_006249 [Seison nebaliae]